jgi:hypothetical protein
MCISVSDELAASIILIDSGSRETCTHLPHGQVLIPEDSTLHLDTVYVNFKERQVYIIRSL